MNHNTPAPLSSRPLPLCHLSRNQRRVMSGAQLKAHGVSHSVAQEQCREGGPWQQLLPGVFLLHPGPPTSDERLHAVLLYAARVQATRTRMDAVPSQPAPGATPGPAAVPDGPVASPYRDAMVTGLAALSLHGFCAAPPAASLDHIDVLVPRTRRLRSTEFARLVRATWLPAPVQLQGVPVAPVPRALADAVAGLSDANAVRRLLTEAVRGGHCEPAAVVRELNQCRLLTRPHVVDAVDSLLAEGRAIAEDRLYAMVREHGLPDPVWNVDLRLPGGPHLGGVDAYWPEHAVAVELDTRAPRQDEDALWSEYARKREHLERLGITVVHITPKKLRESVEQQATVVRTALMTSDERDPAAYVVVLPR
ncbi:hypothetical protein [Streptomyces beihaiensis]|uniref:DUF559 domain-containing protein n=1 Tax=Streptomyces beihaiensis TaxID=2984495 RepID=A0ABT3TQ30_9ACTN|nr:hypothetical protein [Streptomyces beihaiensis]MCX3059152.1 hypothetical protein [Streptomyces beihaiensis]